MTVEHKDWCHSLNIMLTSLPPKPAKCNCGAVTEEQEPRTTRPWVEVTTAEQKALWKISKNAGEFARLLLAKCKEKNT